MTLQEANELRKDHIAEGVRDVRNVLCNLDTREKIDILWFMMDDIVKERCEEYNLDFASSRKAFVESYLYNADWTRKGVLI